MRAFLIDDEPDSIEVMTSLLKQYFPNDVVVVGSAASAEKAYDLVNELKPDLIFLDIQMPEENGFVFLKKFSTINFEIIFVTSYDQYALRAIKFSALDYLLKPVMLKDLENAIRKAAQVLEQKTFRQSQVLNLITNLELNQGSQKIAVHHGDEVRFLKLSDVVYFEAQGRYTRIHLVTGEQFLISSHLLALEESLEETDLFVRVSKSNLIHVDHIVAYSKNEPYHIELVNGEVFEVARRKRLEVLEKLRERKMQVKYK